MSKIPKDINTRTSIYILKDPRNEDIRYVGKTVDKLNTRLSGHISDSKRKNRHVCKWVNSLTKLGLKPIIEEVDFSEWCESAFWEVYYISLFKSWGYNLCNHTIGGEGCIGNKWSFQTLQKAKTTFLKNARKVYQYSLNGDLIKEWDYCRLVALTLNLNATKIIACCKGKRGSHGGFLWNYNKLTLPPYVPKKPGKPLSLVHNNFVKASRKVILEYNNGNVVICNSMKEASTVSGVNKTTICEMCKGHRVAKGNIKFRYG